MKKLVSISSFILLISLNGVSSIGFSNYINKTFEINDNITQDPDRDEREFQFVLSELGRVHKLLFQLPYEYEYIKSVIMPEIEKQRLLVAPHYPSRNETGDDQNLVMKAFRFWFDNYKQECYDYIQYVDNYINEHHK